MRLLVHVVEKRKSCGKNKSVDGGEQAQQQDPFAFVQFWLRHDGGFFIKKNDCRKENKLQDNLCKALVLVAYQKHFRFDVGG
jgi:hypothetical protein